ncbi:MAG: hypothetical protein GIKADHBN_02205 [Phycisphaerales bacterium]|nr:hypothetical protein [Phycisphaerales bacterium]
MLSGPPLDSNDTDWYTSSAYTGGLTSDTSSARLPSETTDAVPRKFPPRGLITAAPNPSSRSSLAAASGSAGASAALRSGVTALFQCRPASVGPGRGTSISR